MTPAASASSAPADAAPPPTVPANAAKNTSGSGARTRPAASASVPAPTQPPPHAGTSRPGAWCGPCGGVRGPHTYHHDDAAHQRAWRRYEGLRAKAASTSFPHEADACRAKADAMRDKYGL